MAVLLFAQTINPWTDLTHSSVDANGYVHLRWSDIGEVTGNTQCLYKIGTGAWNIVEPSIPVPGSMEALVPYTFGQRMRYRLRYTTQTEEGEFSLLHAAYSDADTFPPNINNMAYISTDPAGDLLVGTSTNLDIRETYTAATANKIYFSMKNVSGVYPTTNSIFSYNAYMCNIISAEAAMVDSVTYAMIYSATIPLVLSNGLYKVGYDAESELPVFTRLGNIQAQVSGGVLHMACNLSDLVNDPSFGEWPNTYNGLALSASTISLSISPTLTIDEGDYSNPAGVFFIDNVYDVAVNHPPVVNFLDYNADTGMLYLTYSDLDGDYPLVAEVSDSDNIVVQAFPSDMLNYSNWFALMPVGEQGTLTWHFSDNGFTMVTGQYNPTAAEDEVLLPTPVTCQMPNPYKPNSIITLKGLDTNPLKVALFNLRGQKVGDIYAGIPNSTEQILNLNGNLASGIYFLRIEQGSRSYNHKFVIAK
jgi:hypothetical protein